MIFSQKLSKILSEKGLESKSGKWWETVQVNDNYGVDFNLVNHKVSGGFYTLAYSLTDLIKQATKVWSKDNCVSRGCTKDHSKAISRHHIHRIIDLILEGKPVENYIIKWLGGE